MKLSKNLMVVAGLTALVAATYFGFGAANQANTVSAETAADSKSKAKGKVDLQTDKAKLGYSFGARIGQDIAAGGMVEEIDLNAFLEGIRDVASGNDARMTPEEMQQAQQAFQRKKTEEFEALGADNKTKGEAFLATNKAEEGVIITDSGLQYQVVREGKGKQASAENNVKIHYLGTLIDGTPFDSSYQRNQPADFPVTGVIPGFSEGLQLMKEGAKYRFVIPSDLAYGNQAPPAIGPNQVLIFEVELLEVN